MTIINRIRKIPSDVIIKRRYSATMLSSSYYSRPLATISTRNYQQQQQCKNNDPATTWMMLMAAALATATAAAAATNTNTIFHKNSNNNSSSNKEVVEPSGWQIISSIARNTPTRCDDDNSSKNNKYWNEFVNRTQRQQQQKQKEANHHYDHIEEDDDDRNVEIGDDGLPIYGSSSDPMPMMINDEMPLEQIYLQPIPRRTKNKIRNTTTEERSNKSNDDNDDDYKKSIRAFERILFFGNENNNNCETDITKNYDDCNDDNSNNINNRYHQQQKQEEQPSTLPSVVATSVNHQPHQILPDSPTDPGMIVDKISTTQQHSKYYDHDDTHPRQHTPMVMTQKMYFFQHPRLNVKDLHKLVLLGGPSSEELSWDIADLLGISSPNRMDVGQYNDGESRVQIEDSVRGKQVFLIQSTTSSDAVIELLLLISTLRRASAKKIVAIIPYYGYCRQDERRTREPIAAADVALLLEIMGVDQVMCMDLHSDSLRGFFSPNVPVEHLMPVPVAAAYFHEELSGMSQKEHNTNKDTKETSSRSKKGKAKKESSYPKVTVVASHESQVGRATHFRSVLQNLAGRDNEDNIELAVLSKSRIPPGKTHYEPKLVGNVKGRKCILVDDIVNTGTTMVSNIQMLKQEGAESIYAWATHGVFGPGGQGHNMNNAPERLQAMDELKYLLVSNSVMNQRELPSKIRLLNIAPLLAEAIARTMHSESVSSILDLERLDGDGNNTNKTSNKNSPIGNSNDITKQTKPERYDND